MLSAEPGRLDLYEALWERLPDIKRATFTFKEFVAGACQSSEADQFLAAMMRELAATAAGLHGCLEQFEAQLSKDLADLHAQEREPTRRQWDELDGRVQRSEALNVEEAW